MLPDRIKKRLKKNRPMTSVTLRMPADVVADLKVMAPELGFTGYQPLIRAYISECMRRDEERLRSGQAQHLADALEARGVDKDLIDDALAETRATYDSSKPKL
jgi:hypothetical protein